MSGEAIDKRTRSIRQGSGHVAAPNRKAPIPHDTTLYRGRHKIENMFGRLEPHPHPYDRCAHTFMSAISLAAVVIFWM